MHKKKYLALLFIMLFMLLFASFSTSYADINRDWTLSDVKNVIYNRETARGIGESSMEAWIEANETLCQTIQTMLNSYDYVFIHQFGNNAGDTILFQCQNVVNARWYRYSASDNRVVSSSSSDRQVIFFQVSTNNPSNQSYTKLNAWPDSQYTNSNWYYTNKPIYTGSNGSTVWLSSGSTSNFFTGPYTDMSQWGVISYPYSSITIPGIETANGTIYLSYYDTIYSPYQTWSGAWLGGADEIDSCVVKYWRYNRVANKWFQANNNLNGAFTTIDASDNSCWLYIDNRFVVSDSFVTATIKHKTDATKNYIVYLYLATDNTVINNGSLDIISTIGNYALSGDNGYYDNSNDISNEVFQEDLLSTTLDSGDEPKFDDLPIITIESGDDPSNDFFTWLLLQVQDVLNYSGDTVLNVPIWKTNYPIRSDVFKLTIEPLRTFISAGWWFIVGVPVLKFIRSSINKLKGGEIPASDDKSDLLNNVL